MPTRGAGIVKPTSIVSTGTGNSSSINTNGSVTFSTCATLSLNGVFTADYDNYMVVMRMVWSSAGSDNLIFRLRSSGSDNSTANSYVYQQLFAGSTTVIASRTTSDKAYIAGIGGTYRDGLILNLYGPGLAQATAGRSATCSSENSAAIFDYAFTHNQSTAYDGATFYTGTGSFSGLVAVYGMRN